MSQTRAALPTVLESEPSASANSPPSHENSGAGSSEPAATQPLPVPNVPLHQVVLKTVMLIDRLLEHKPLIASEMLDSAQVREAVIHVYKKLDAQQLEAQQTESRRLEASQPADTVIAAGDSDRGAGEEAKSDTVALLHKYIQLAVVLINRLLERQFLSGEECQWASRTRTVMSNFYKELVKAEPEEAAPSS